MLAFQITEQPRHGEGCADSNVAKDADQDYQEWTEGHPLEWIELREEEERGINIIQ